MGPRFKVPSDELEKPGIEPATPGLQGEWHNHCTMEASSCADGSVVKTIFFFNQFYVPFKVISAHGAKNMGEPQEKSTGHTLKQKFACLTCA